MLCQADAQKISYRLKRFQMGSIQMMQLAETAFTEWNDEEEDIYDV